MYTFGVSTIYVCIRFGILSLETSVSLGMLSIYAINDAITRTREINRRDIAMTTSTG